MQQNETLNNIIRLLADRQLGTAIGQTEIYLLARPQQQADMERLQAVKSDYALLLHYWQQGFDDPQRPALYDQLLRRLYTLVTNLQLNDHLRTSPYLKNVYSRPRQSGRQWSVAAIRSQLEDYVSTLAMLELEPEHVRQAKTKALHEAHAQQMNDLFDYIFTSRLWSNELADTFTQMLLSPTIDATDQQLILSAISLSVMQAFGYHKFSVLCRVYEQTDDEALRQRALVGWALALDPMRLALFPEAKERIAALCAVERTRQELTELQMQLIYCMEAEDDGRRIKDEIMPELMKGSNIRMTRHGLEEIDEDSLEEILHPEAAEQQMEQMEQSMHRMADMQKHGADIYFGGFSQMKRFPFFNSLASWFVPFYPEHPAVSTIWQQTKGKRFLETITRIGAFCDSDKYSFVLAFEKVLERIPQSMLALVEQGEASPIPIGGSIDDDEQRQPAFIRRLYLQNLYRFFRLFPVRGEFFNPFADPIRFVFFANPIFRGTQLQERSAEVATFLLKRKRTAELMLVLNSMDSQYHDYHYYILRARAETDVDSQRQLYRKALDARPDAEQALAGWARGSFDAHDYDAAITAYRQLVARQPERLSYEISLAACLANAGQTAEAEPLLFKLQYMNPDHLGIMRTLAWTLTASGKYEQAERYYQQLLKAEAPLADDTVNYAICLWLKGSPADAITMLKGLGDDVDVADSIRVEQGFLTAHGLTAIDVQLMLDSL